MKGISGLFREQAARTPEGAAIVHGGQSVTYAALLARADRLARILRRKGVTSDSVVAIGMSHSPELVTALLALAQIRAAYVGLDSAWPLTRVRDVMRLAGPSVLLVDSVHAPLVPSESEAVLIEHLLQIDDRADAAQAPDVDEDVREDELHSIVFTSGTTGQPRGVLVTVGSVLTRLRWMWERYPFRRGDKTLLHRTCTVVGFSWDCFGGLLQGVPIIVSPVTDRRDVIGIVKAAIKSGVTHVAASVGFWATVLEWTERQPAPVWPSLRVARTSGEPLPPGLIPRWQEAFPRAALLNIYGATECNGVTAFEASTLVGRLSRVPVGTSLPGAELLVVDDQMDAVGIDKRGEICLGGAMLARGYLADAALTASRFVPHPAGSVPGARVFRTGDFGFWRRDGLLELIGRRDLQVKVRGHRVEIEEVENALRACAGVCAAAVDARSQRGETRLVAFIVPFDDELSVNGLRGALAEFVPDYMVPAEFFAVSGLPRMSNGKIDRAALSLLEGVALRTAAASAPVSASEVTVATIWSAVLGMTDVGADDNLFEIGGDSLIAARIASRVEEAFGLSVPVRTVFDRPSVRKLASHIDALLEGRTSSTLRA